MKSTSIFLIGLAFTSSAFATNPIEIDDYAPGKITMPWPSKLHFDHSDNLLVTGLLEKKPSTALEHLTRKWDGHAWTTVDEFPIQGHVLSTGDIYVQPDNSAYLSYAEAYDGAYQYNWKVRKQTQTGWQTVDEFTYAPQKLTTPAQFMTSASGELYLAGSATASTNHWHGIIRKWNGSSFATVADVSDGDSSDTTFDSAVSDSYGNMFVAGYNMKAAVGYNMRTALGSNTKTTTIDAVVWRWDGSSVHEIFRAPTGKIRLGGHVQVEVDALKNVYFYFQKEYTNGNFEWDTVKYDQTTWSALPALSYKKGQFVFFTLRVDASGHPILLGSVDNVSQFIHFDGSVWLTTPLNMGPGLKPGGTILDATFGPDKKPYFTGYMNKTDGPHWLVWQWENP